MTSFTLSSDDWLTRETQFAAFATGPLLDFWRQREEGEFSGVDGVPIRFVRFRSARHQRVVVVSPGRIESYVKYPEVAYDLFHCGYDVVIVDHRGQGRSGRLLADTHRGHVVNFADYVDDFEQLWLREVESRGYRQRFALAHSMGGAIAAEVAIAQPDRVRGLVLISSAGYGVREPWFLRPLRWPVIGRITGVPTRWATARLLRAAYAVPSRVTDADIDQYYWSAALPGSARAFRAVARSFRFDGLSGRFDRVTPPTLLIWGAQDRLTPLELAQRIPRLLQRKVELRNLLGDVIDDCLLLPERFEVDVHIVQQVDHGVGLGMDLVYQLASRLDDEHPFAGFRDA